MIPCEPGDRRGSRTDDVYTPLPRCETRGGRISLATTARHVLTFGIVLLVAVACAADDTLPPFDAGCIPDCGGKQCGSDGCGGICGTCQPGLFCSGEGQCSGQCTPNCVDKECGSDGCGGSCGTCEQYFACEGGECVYQPGCGDGTCATNLTETCETCPLDCPCGCGETCADGSCAFSACADKQCGDDGCGGSCGVCSAGQNCTELGHCTIGCVPSCAGKQCGNDGCGYACGQCGCGEMCEAGKCVFHGCDGKECGSDGCGNACGQCQAGYKCNEQGKCVEVVGGCYPKACLTKDHCAACPAGLEQCWVEQHECVECLPGQAEQCPTPLKCSLSGKCTEKTCPTNADGVPTIQCASDTDCEACGPEHNVCDAMLKKCVQCVELADPHCLSSQYCKDGKCDPKCPSSCQTDNDCAHCAFGVAAGGETSAAKACNNHKCSECSGAQPCGGGQEFCLGSGVCQKPCGFPSQVQGTCLSDDDCYYCGDPKALGSYVCKKPINDPEGHGSCIPPAKACADVAAGSKVLPKPWSLYSQLCSGDSDCQDVSAELNVGKTIRDLAGVNEILGIQIGDVVLKYGMEECGEISLFNNVDCGICVPCQADVDCDPIQVDPVIDEMFKGNPLAQVAGLMLINMLWGDNADHNLYFYCQPVGLGYGICAPCANPLQFCGKQEPEPGTGTCNHNVCMKGGALDPSCSTCAKEVCANDAYCCTTAWDDICVSEVDKLCASSCSGTTSCADGICTNPGLPAQHPLCGLCVAAVCEFDPYCCNKEGGEWDKYCVFEAKAEATCDAQCSGGCAHSECETGGPLAADCSDCAASVYSYDDWCCSIDWGSACVDAAKKDPDCPCV